MINMKCVAIIPARWDSSRFKGKILTRINGKPMLRHVWEKVKKAKEIDDVFIAVDKERVFRAVEAFGGKAVYTSLDHTSGTDRIAEAAKNLDADIIVNIQADEPLVNPAMIDELVQIFQYEPKVQMATLIKRIENIEDISNPNIVKVVTDRRGYALYFSRSPIPYLRKNGEIWEGEEREPSITRYFKHIGLYAYTKEFLLSFASLPTSLLEEDEKLEQLRALEHGYKIMTKETRYSTIGVDIPADVERVKAFLKDENRPFVK
ncbi:3-deoxy-D-manno-octulosonate cytidylyltransferase [Candidatus Omnitrophus magneticus]|uniref:3-deoxy-manno-octulosonate cytidylyltransferase n=1 Tax=Candidatus Omnitrophus magneticus TaxID=1609969 RepID=A0A0F0CVY8_9BACT|nr:3-deoxy-D-manno-octulosonate cytidylyltransferase [Candidatus Omnitrophus magneticus]